LQAVENAAMHGSVLGMPLTHEMHALLTFALGFVHTGSLEPLLLLAAPELELDVDVAPLLLPLLLLLLVEVFPELELEVVVVPAPVPVELLLPHATVKASPAKLATAPRVHIFILTRPPHQESASSARDPRDPQGPRKPPLARRIRRREPGVHAPFCRCNLCWGRIAARAIS
jgi:hypothetical protein